MKNIQIPWYLNTWVIALCFFFSWLLIPLFLGIYLVIQQQKILRFYDDEFEEPNFAMKRKQAQNEYENKKNLLASQLENEMSVELLKKKELHDEIKRLEDEYITAVDKTDAQKQGFFETNYKFEKSITYKNKLNELRTIQKDLVKTKKAVNFTDKWTVNGSLSEGKKMMNQNIKLALRMFNVESDLTISKVSFRNFESSKKRIITSHKLINDMNKVQELSITDDYLSLKLEELELAYEYELKIEEEKEKLRMHKEQLREEQKVLKEIENAKKKFEKEETHFNNAIADVKNMINTADKNEISALENKLLELEKQLSEINQQKEDVLNRATNTRAGYVYIISNIGSFGEDIYKIGVTRRLDPYERIKELSSASVPFPFDVHAMIFSEDAPHLENTLHKYFYDKRLNKVNDRKEFFREKISNIQTVVEENYNDVTEFIIEAEAQQYRDSVL